MKKLILISILLLFETGFSQLINLNPDPNGEPWYVGGLRVPDKNELARIPTIELSENYLRGIQTTLPSRHDNTQEIYFRPIFNQSDGSCSQASGIAYNFTYEINRERGTSAQITDNQYPSHYTYNFLNDGSGDNGSWYTDGWNIIKANGCPNVPTYGGGIATGGPRRWMSGYNEFETSMNNRIKEYFSIDVSTPQGLQTLKHWLYDHLEGASTGSLVNFAAGIGNIGYNETNNHIITSWGFVANHAMTFVGWDDTIEYDYNNDGQITNNIDINNDGVIDMRDWERGALIMVNSWGLSWGQNGKAYVMYKTLAEDMIHGGIVGNKVFGIRVKTSQTPQLKMRVKMIYTKRKHIKIAAGVATDINATEPEHRIEFPLFNYQGGEYPMNGFDNNPYEFSMDISPLLQYVTPDTPTKFFLIVTENDENGVSNGHIIDFALVSNTGQEYTCPQHNVNLVNNDDTLLSITTSIDYNGPQITTTQLPVAQINTNYSYTLQASNGTPDYMWEVLQHYNKFNINENYPDISTNPVTTNNDDDGYGAQTLDFDFPFYGQTYNQLYVSTDGSIIFEPDFPYIRSETAIKNYKVISVFASDLMMFPADGDGIFYEGDTTHATFRWKTSLYGNQSANIDVAVTLYPNGDIKFYYGNNITPDLNWAAGISNGEGSYVILDNSGVANPNNIQKKLEAVPYPNGMFISSDGVFQGTAPNEVNTWNIDFVVKDNNNVSKLKTLVFETVTSNSIDQNDIFKLKVYPNPVKTKAKFVYELKNQADVRLQIMDLTGKTVETVLHKKQKAGIYQILWQNNLPAGVYVYKLDTGEQSQTGKIIVQ